MKCCLYQVGNGIVLHCIVCGLRTGIAKSVTVQCLLLSCLVLAVCGPSDGILNVVIIKLLTFVLPLMAAAVIICGLSVCVLCISTLDAVCMLTKP